MSDFLQRSYRPWRVMNAVAQPSPGWCQRTARCSAEAGARGPACLPGHVLSEHCGAPAARVPGYAASAAPAAAGRLRPRLEVLLFNTSEKFHSRFGEVRFD